MPFLSGKSICNYQSILRKVIIFRVNPHFSHHYPKPKPVRRVSRFISREREGKKLPGSMTVEASIAVPLFLFFMINILSTILFFHTFATNLEELHQQGRQLSMLAYSGDGGLLEDEMIELVRPARVKAPVPVLAYPGTTIVSCCYMRAWTGYDVEHKTESGEEEIYVYITDGGSVYHRSRSCSHLTLSIELVSKTEAEELRNQSGAKYYPCERCGSSAGGMVYVTREGNRYHSTISCSGLKRTVRCISLSEAGGRPACSRCG